MATAYAQAERPLAVNTPLGKDKLLLVGLSGHEGISQLFSFDLELLADNKTDVAFDNLLGQKITVSLALPKHKKRYLNGICHWVMQGGRDDKFTAYRLQIVPQLWLLTKRVQSRIFQHLTVPDILKKVLTGLDVTYEIQGKFEPRDYCVQYRESDFNFASRLMEEEGIYYFFKHADGSHKLVLANTPGSHPDMPEPSKILFEKALGGTRTDERIEDWQKVQELRSGKVTLWDHNFELPHKHLEADKTIQESVPAGKVTHKLKVGGNDKLEIYDYPGAYAQRFDGIDKGGGAQAAEVQKIFTDNKRTVEIRMQEEALPSLQIQATSNCRNLVSGHKFTLDRHFNADGQYVITGIQHSARVNAGYVAGQADGFDYRNTFTCIPFALPFRPARKTPRPTVQGSQTAVVVGPAGEEIFPDKYGRVKVQFFWDREGKHNADSSCWVRVAQAYAGKGWGSVCIPRIGQEVMVDFLEGDPDQPIITGRVYNAENMPPYPLPAKKMVSGLKSNSTPGGGGYNEFIMDDTKGNELIRVHGQFDMDTKIEHDLREHVLHDRSRDVTNNETIKIGNDRVETVSGNETLSVTKDRKETITGNETLAVAKNRTRAVSKNESVTVTLTRTHTVGVNEAITVGAAQEVTVGGFRAVTVGGYQAYTVAGYQNVSIGRKLSENIGSDHLENVGGKRGAVVAKDEALNVGGNRGTDVKGEDSLKIGKKLTVDVADEILFKTGDASIHLKSDGTITIKGKDIHVQGSGKINAKCDSDMTLKGSNIHAN
jgi:type VI secretion system secreted protein VgrG